MAKNAAQQIFDCGQGLWYDNISRELLENGELKRMIEEWGVRGLTSNPSIFDNALSKGTAYDAQVASLKGQSLSTDQVFDELAIQDIAAAADLLRPVYDSDGTDGFVSIEVSPLLARDTDATIAEAKRLFARLDRPNVMIKIPGTAEGLPAVKAALEAGINVNITLLFSLENYLQVAQTYCEALRTRVSRGEPVDKIRSVASFFVSRVDSIIDSKLQEIVSANEKSDPAKAEKAQGLQGRFGIDNCKVVYAHFQDMFYGEKFADLKKAGAAPQRPLWASTSTKNPEYRDTIYVEQLLGPDTVNTMPHNTLEAVVDHGVIKPETVTQGVEEAKACQAALESVGVDVNACLAHLQAEGVEKFITSFHQLNETLEKKIAG